MTEFEGILALQVDALLGSLHAQEERRCREILREAESRADEFVRRRRRELRERVHQAVDEERRHRRAELTRARQRIETAKRRELQALYAELLHRAWPLLVEALRRRWTSAEQREEWCEMLVEEALRAFGSSAWTIEHPASWSATDTASLEKILERHGLPEPACRADAGIAAGLRIHRDAACLDGTIDGLLARRGAVEGRLLAVWEGRPDETGSEQ